MANFDGIDDILLVTLPEWCSWVQSMSVLWLDAWIAPTSKVDTNMILFDLYSGPTPVLRWYLRSSGKQVYAVLMIYPTGVSLCLPDHSFALARMK